MNNIKKIGNITPYKFQMGVIDDILNHIRYQYGLMSTGNSVECDAGVIEAYVSSGKTVIMAAVANHCVNVGAKVMILARSAELVKQNADECWNMGVKASICSASLGIKSCVNNCVVGTEGTVVNSMNKELSGFNPDIILIDECHQVDHKDYVNNCETDYSKIIKYFKSKKSRLIVIGLTGTPYRGVNSIVSKDGFWKSFIGNSIGREFLVENKYIVPTIFGYSDVEYNYDGFDSKCEFGISDFSKVELEKMMSKVDNTTTCKIVEDFIRAAENRNSVLITCASYKHCEDVSKYLPAGSFVIITTKLGLKERLEKIKMVKDGKIKYTLQIGCLTTGVNIPLWDTSVILRRIGSLTLLVQLLGRGMRLLKHEHLELGYVKTNHLVLDYSGTLESMHNMYDNPLLGDAVLAMSKKRKKQLKICPKCKSENSEFARRCIGKVLSFDDVENDSRCDYFWSSKKCEKCNIENDTSSVTCRACGESMIDYNEKLSGTHYKVDDFFPVKDISFKATKKNGIYVIINFIENNNVNQGPVKLFYSPFSSKIGMKLFSCNFLQKFCKNWGDINKIKNCKTAYDMAKLSYLIVKPSSCTHRKNKKGYSIVSKLIL